MFYGPIHFTSISTWLMLSMFQLVGSSHSWVLLFFFLMSFLYVNYMQKSFLIKTKWLSHGHTLVKCTAWKKILPSFSDSKESACNVGDPGLIPGLGRSLGGRHGNLLQYSWDSLVAQSVKIICLQYKRPRFDSWMGKTPWKRKWQPTSVFLPGESHGQRSLAGYNPWDHKSQTWLSN